MPLKAFRVQNRGRYPPCIAKSDAMFSKSSNMTAEVSFANSFLATLDSKPIKLQPDYAADPKTLELHGPVGMDLFTFAPPANPLRTVRSLSNS